LEKERRGKYDRTRMKKKKKDRGISPAIKSGGRKMKRIETTR